MRMAKPTLMEICESTRINFGVDQQLLNQHQFNQQESAKNNPKPLREQFEETPRLIFLMVYIVYVILIAFGHLRDFLRKIGLERNKMTEERNRKGYVPLYQNFENFYKRNIFRRARECANTPLCTVPGVHTKFIERVSKDYNWSFELTSRVCDAINMGSYNYLGFAENNGPCSESVEESILEYGCGTCSTRCELGNLDIHTELETLVAEFVGCEASIVVGMGFAANYTSIPTLESRGCLILSDELNHASIVLGCRLSKADVKIFKHNDMNDLEAKLRTAILEGQSKTHRAWKKIMVIVEGVYSMEGSIVNLPAILELKRKYKFYLYVDEAHSIGALGPRGRGVCDYFGCNPNDVDILMGTFTKSFGGAGGYIAGSKKLVNHLRRYSYGFTYATSMSGCISQQILTAMKIIMGKDGSNEGITRIRQLKRNTCYFREKLKQRGFIVYGNDDSPVVPLMIYFPSKVILLFRHLLKNGIATVVVGYPATSLSTARARFCISAAHTKQMLDKVLTVVDSIGHLIMIDYSRKNPSSKEVIY